MMRIVSVVGVVVYLCGTTLGQQAPGPNYEHLKCFEQLIGTWVYEGPLLEDIPGLAAKDTKVVTRLTYRWILKKNAIETVSSTEVDGGAELRGKGLTGWDAAGQRIVGGSMNSLGGYDLSTTTYDAATKTWTVELEGTDAAGTTFTSTIVGTLTDPDTLVGQVTQRTGGTTQDPGPRITFKRAPAPKRPAAAQPTAAPPK